MGRPGGGSEEDCSSSSLRRFSRLGSWRGIVKFGAWVFFIIFSSWSSIMRLSNKSGLLSHPIPPSRTALSTSKKTSSTSCSNPHWILSYFRPQTCPWGLLPQLPPSMSRLMEVLLPTSTLGCELSDRHSVLLDSQLPLLDLEMDVLIFGIAQWETPGYMVELCLWVRII